MPLLRDCDTSKTSPVITQITVLNPSIHITVLELDLASQGAIHKAAAEVNARVDKIAVLANNAGVTASSESETTKEVIKLQFGTTHIEHFLSTNSMIKKSLKASEEPGAPMIANISSTGLGLNSISLTIRISTYTTLSYTTIQLL